MQLQKPTRIFEEIAPGKYRQTPGVLYPDGKRIYYPITNRKILEASDLPGLPQNLPIISKSTQMYPNQQIAPALTYAETAGGQRVAGRMEAPIGVAGSDVRVAMKIVLNNAGANDETVIIGDGAGLIAAYLKSAAPFGTDTTSEGVYGANTLQTFKEVTKSAGLDMHGIHIAGFTANSSTPNSTPFDVGAFDLLSISPAFQNLNVRNLPLSDLVTGADNRDNIRQDGNFRFAFSAFSAMRVTVPSGTKVVITFKTLSAVGVPGLFLKPSAWDR